MKVYRCAIDSPELGTLLTWHPSKHAAVTHAYRMTSDDEDLSLMAIDMLDIPTDKAGLLGWLNAYFDTDNG